METLASRIKEYRQKRGLTQAEVAEVAGISRNSYILIEKGITKDILLQTAIGISKALSIPFSELYGINDMMDNKESDRLKVLAFHSLDRYESFQSLFNPYTELKSETEREEKFQEHRKRLREFKKGVLETMVNVGFCTLEEISEYYDYVNKRGKYKPKTNTEN